jgi:hypothetical protein
MNLYGSYRKLRDNSVAALVSSIEIYNKPLIDYRNEISTILLINAWELLLKAILSKNRERIFSPKKRNHPYKTLSIEESLETAKSYFPSEIPYEAVYENIKRIIEYRNNAIHFYNEDGFEILMDGLIQTSIVNYRDLLNSVFCIDVAEEINLCLLPLSFSNPPDPIVFLKKCNFSKNRTVAEYIRLISETTQNLERRDIDTGRFLTVFKVSLQSTKKISSADITAKISPDANSNIVSRKVDPNLSHPLLRMNILEEIGDLLHGINFNQYTFEAIAWSEKLKENSRYCWKANTGGPPHYSRDIIAYLKNMTKAQISACRSKYKNRKSIIPHA